MTDYLIVIDPQRIFADPESPWGATGFANIVEPIRELAAAHAGRVIVTRWVADTVPRGSWREYFNTWPFAKLPPDDVHFDIVDQLADIADTTVTATTFGKWIPELTAITGPQPHVVLAGVSTDCCVISTALAAADAGAYVTVASDGCAGSTNHNHAAALDIMGLYEPQIRVRLTRQILNGQP